MDRTWVCTEALEVKGLLGAVVSFAHDQLQRKTKRSAAVQQSLGLCVCVGGGGDNWKDTPIQPTGLTLSCSTCSGFSSFCTVWGGGEELMMIDICGQGRPGAG